MQNIKLDLPAHPGILNRAAAFLEGCANELTMAGTTNAKADDTPPPPPGNDEDKAPELSEADFESLFKPQAGDDTPPPPPVETVADDGIERDSAGFPWDERIHSGNKKKYSDGSSRGEWFRRRGVTPDRTAEVEAELLASGKAIDPELGATTTTTEDTPPPPPPAETAGDDTPPPPPPSEAKVGARSVNNFPELMALVQALKAAGKINDAQLNEQATAVAGVPNVALMATKADLIPALGLAIQAVAGV